MPSQSAKQHRLMEMVAHDPKMAKKVGIPQSVGKEFAEADKGKHFLKGGNTMATMNPMAAKRAAALIAARKAAPAMAAPAAPMGGMGGMGMGMKHGGLSKSHHKHLAEHHLGMAEHHMHMAHGGMAETMGPKNMSEDVEKGSNKDLKHGEHGVQKRGHTRALEEKMKGNDVGNYKHGGKAHVKKYAAGGHVKHSEHMGKVHTNTKAPHGDGIAKRGHTKAMMPKMHGKKI